MAIRRTAQAGAVGLRLRPVSFDDACAFVRAHHRHSKPPQGFKFCVGAADDTALRGVAIAGRPVARHLDDGYTIEVLRLCSDGTPNACSMLYGACARAAAALGYRTVVTYTRAAEGGASLRASGFCAVSVVADRQWDTPSRPREERELVGDKVRWERET